MSRPGEPDGAESLRRRNAAAVVRALREEGPGSRADLATRTGLAKATVGTSAPPSFALLELSEAMTPRTSPLPNVSAASFSVLSAWP